MTLALSSLRGSSHCWVRALGAGLDPGRPPELGWLHTLLSAGSYTPQGRVKERCVWESAAHGAKCRDGMAELKSERCLLSVEGSTRLRPNRADRAVLDSNVLTTLLYHNINCQDEETHTQYTQNQSFVRNVATKSFLKIFIIFSPFNSNLVS